MLYPINLKIKIINSRHSASYQHAADSKSSIVLYYVGSLNFESPFRFCGLNILCLLAVFPRWPIDNFSYPRGEVGAVCTSVDGFCAKLTLFVQLDIVRKKLRFEQSVNVVCTNVNVVCTKKVNVISTKLTLFVHSFEEAKKKIVKLFLIQKPLHTFAL